MKLKAGDIVKMSRKNKEYYQYGVYLGQEEVIHYLETPKIKGKVTKTSMKEFKKKNGTIELVVFPQTKEGRSTTLKKEVFLEVEGLISSDTWPEWFMGQYDEYVVNTRKEVLHKAKSKLGRDGEIVFNNGEHFAWWCKVELTRANKNLQELDELLNPKVKLSRFSLSKQSS